MEVCGNQLNTLEYVVFILLVPLENPLGLVAFHQIKRVIPIIYPQGLKRDKFSKKMRQIRNDTKEKKKEVRSKNIQQEWSPRFHVLSVMQCWVINTV